MSEPKESSSARWIGAEPVGPPDDEFVFGDPLVAAPSSEPAAWLPAAINGPAGTVGALVPARYESYVRIGSASARMADWLAAQRQIIVALAEVLGAHTETPDDAWFAIWEGHDSQWSSFPSAFRGLPRFDLPNRTYFLLAGRVADVGQIVEPLAPRVWRRTDLWWPQDHRWFVGTDVDFWANYVGGSRALTDAITSRLPGLCEPVTLDDALHDED